ncbi:unnamed protein product [Diatraea saccharalis]|uniref:G-protein coupled receptors family 1 profile domain-containing protein n=1 Tax=Diatraea saccharalis TaxID=40085 RepID=A0A9P0G0Q4_9NEOP|nr:unnamed protein product [Diatraea saccharalis]
MAALFAIVLERYLQARFYRREKSLYFRWYWTLVGLCWLSAVVFATPPLFSYGLYSCDATGTVCTLLWPSTNAGSRHIGFAVPYVVICGVAPVIAIFYFMGKAIRLEKIYYRSEQQREQKRLTKSVHALTVATLALWIPAAILVGWQWLPLLVYGYRPHVPPALALIAPIAAEAATSIPVLCYLTVDERLRAALLGRMRRNYALLHPCRAKKFNLNLLSNYSNNSYISLEKNNRKSTNNLWYKNTTV